MAYSNIQYKRLLGGTEQNHGRFVRIAGLLAVNRISHSKICGRIASHKEPRSKCYCNPRQ